MANLSPDQIKEQIKKPQRRTEIEQAIKHESKLKLHCQTIVDKSEFGEPQKAFLSWVSEILPPDIYARFETLFQPPFPTLELTESIFTEISRIFEGQNQFFKFEFKNPDYVEDISDYLISLDDHSFWKTTAFETLQYALNSYVVVDLPEVQTTPLPEPYYYLLDINKVHDVSYTRKGDVEWIIINEGRDADQKEHYLYIDDQVYQRIVDDVAFAPVLHPLGYTPVKDFWKTRRSRFNQVDKKGPITKSLGELNWLLFFEISKKYLDLYAPYPIYSAYEQKCPGNEFGSCEHGKIRIEQGYTDCTTCKGKGSLKIGVGAFIQVPIPSKDSNGYETPDLRNPVQVLPAEINSLTYCVSEIKRLEREIFENCIGKGGEPSSDQAKNEKQIQGAFESKINVLERVKTNFEIINKWTIDTLCYYRYGDSFINSTYNYGDVSYLDTVEDLNNDYKNAKTDGKPLFELASKRDRIYNTENKNNSDERLKTEIKKALEPWQSISLEQIKSLGLDKQFPDKFLLKINFDEYIQRFEREQTNILMFASNLDFSSRIGRIKEVLMGYVDEESEAATVEPIQPFKVA